MEQSLKLILKLKTSRYRTVWIVCNYNICKREKVMLYIFCMYIDYVQEYILWTGNTVGENWICKGERWKGDFAVPFWTFEF